MKIEEGRKKKEIKKGREGSVSASTSALSSPHASRLTPRAPYFVPLGLILLTLTVYWPVGGNDFIDYDDDIYVSENPQVQQGLTFKGVRWAFTTTDAGNWHPLTWISHMLDASLFGMNPAGHHWMNLLFHLGSVLLLFSVLLRMTAAVWPSAFVAALFAIHPLHVESVAWAAERKDVLSTFFGLLALWAYAGNVEKRVGAKSLEVGGKRLEAFTSNLKPWTFNYLGVLFLFTLSLMAKPMLVTLPFLLLLLDYWPLGRLRLRKTRDPASTPRSPSASTSTLTFLILEKLPLLALAAASSVITYFVQQKAGAVSTFEQISLPVRIGNALISYVAYLGKMFWPVKLAVFYPHPGSVLPAWQVAGSALLLLAVSVWVVRQAERRPYLPVGWLWYLGTLVPVIGIVQVGIQSMADRYSYIPLIGIFVMIAWTAEEFGMRRGEGGIEAAHGTRKVALSGASGMAILLLAVIARVQLGYWKNSITLFEHALRVTERNAVAHTNLGAALADQELHPQAIPHFLEAIRIDPNLPPAHYNLGIALAKQGKLDEGMKEYAETIRLKPDYYRAYYNMGAALSEQGKYSEATRFYSAAIRLKPDYGEAHNNLGDALIRLGRGDEAMKHYAEALAIQPKSEKVQFNIGIALAEQGKLQEAIARLSEAIRIKPDYLEAHYNLGVALADLGKLEEAKREYLEAIRLKPDYVEAHNNLGALLVRQGMPERAIAHFAEAIRIKPDYLEAHYNLGAVLADQGRLDEAAREFEAVLKINPDLPQARARIEELRGKNKK